MGIFSNLKNEKERLEKEAKTLTDEEKYEKVIDNMNHLKALGLMWTVCGLCKHGFKKWGCDEKTGIEVRQQMHLKVCGNPCSKHFKYDEATKSIIKVE